MSLSSSTSASAPPCLLPGDSSRRWAARIAAPLAGLLALLFVYQGVRIARLPTENRVTWNVVIDDGYYYLQVARNIARGHGATFDRVNKTSGFQPLWALMLTPVFWFTDDPGRGMAAMLVLAALLGGLAVLLLYIGLSRLVGIGAALVACTLVVSNPYFLQICQGGLETPALFVCLCGLFAFWAARSPAILAGDRRSCVLFGLLFGLTVLARTDVALILAPVGLAVLLPGGGSRLNRLLWIAAPGAALLAPYIAWNWITQGTPVPVSGLVKKWVAETHQPTQQLWLQTEQWRGVPRTLHLLVWPYKMPGPEAYARIPKQLLLAIVPLGVLALRLVWSRRARRNTAALVVGLATVLGVAGHGLYIFFVYRSAGHWNYHYFFAFSLLTTVALVAAPALLAADFGLLINRLAGRRLAPGFAALCAALSLLAVGYLAPRGLTSADERFSKLLRDPNESFRKCRYDAAVYMSKHYPHDTAFGAWWAGTVGYFSDRRVVNLDGVINSRRYFERYLKKDQTHRYILDSPITRIADFFWRDPMTSPPAWRAFFWEHDKEHIVARMRARLTPEKVFRFRSSGFYILKVNKD